MKLKQIFHIKVFFIFLLIVNNLSIFAQEKYLKSGPMLSWSTMKEVGIWVQTTENAEVYIEYWEENDPQDVFKTKDKKTKEKDAYTALLIANQLEPGKTYKYTLFINDKKIERPYSTQFQAQKIWKWRNNAPDFSFLSGSCAYINEEKYDRPGEPYGGAYQIFESMHQTNADFMLWLGDNVYLREADWNSETGILHRFTHTRSTKELQALLASKHQYFIWDDHDYGPNNSDRSYHMKNTTTEVFKSFYPSNNYVFKEGITSFFQWSDCDFFLLDNRSWRTPNNRTDIPHHDILGQPQIAWLLDALVNSEASFKFIVVGGQFLSQIESEERFYHYAPQERMQIINAIKKLRIEGVVFLTGDMHFSELSKLDSEDAYTLYDFTISPLTAGPNSNYADENPLSVEGSLFIERNFAKLEILGPKESRTLKLSLFNSNGNLLWNYEIPSSELKFK